jgi:heptosyltransferase-2
LQAHIRHKVSDKNKPRKKLLVIRLQAMGDVVIMLPYIQSLREQLPNITIDLLTRQEVESIPKALNLFNNVYSLGGARNVKRQLLSFLFMYPRLLLKGYDVLLDLQNHNLSKVMRFLLRIKTFTVFDKTSTNYAGNRYKNTINALGIWQVEFKAITNFKENKTNELLQKYGLQKKEFVVINPAGAFTNRNWDLNNYVEFCKLWMQQVNKETKFLILGITKIKDKAVYLQEKIGANVVNAVDMTSPIEAIQLLSEAKLVLTEDSGLMHMSYVCSTPTVGILGSTRNDWTNPNLPHTHFFNSADLPCGNCMLVACKFEEVICLTRVKPKEVLQASLDLLKRISN